MARSARRHPARVNPRRWRAIRVRILDKENWRCRSCGGMARELDHIKPVEDGGAWWAESNLQPLCRGCHIAKTRAENQARRPEQPGEAAWQKLLDSRMGPS